MIVDLRSDTVTRPTEEMRRAMAEAEVGDDVYGDDPTVNALEEMAAEAVGKEASLFVPSGTMGNLISLMAHCSRGESVILGRESHIFHYEAGGVSAVAGLLPITVDDSSSLLDVGEALSSVKGGDNVHFAPTRLCAFEITHNRLGGAAPSPEAASSAMRALKEAGLKVHLDGARIFNAAVAWGVSARVYAEASDSVMFCFSKGLSAPVGSVVCGSREFVARARRFRKLLGGGMRQAGVLAACALVSLRSMVERLREDHENAMVLAEALEEVEGISVEEMPPGCRRTNMVYFAIEGKDARALAERCALRGVLFNAVSPHRVRLVTHKDVSRAMVLEAARVIREELKAL